MYKTKTAYSIYILLLFHIVGVVGLSIDAGDSFAKLTPLNLLLITTTIFFNLRETKTLVALASIFVIGFVIELLGVNTGFPFGEYSYGSVLGPQLFATPLIIGLNWFILLFASNSIVNSVAAIEKRPALKALVAAGLMVSLDFVIEPVAIELSFWTWEAVNPPIENYVSWFAISFLLSLLWQKQWKLEATRLGIGIYLIQLAFFLILNFSLVW